jgi:hypothetical protein
MEEIPSEPSTQSGFSVDALTAGNVHDLVALLPPNAADGLIFDTRDALLAHRSGVTRAIVAPKSLGFIAGVSTAFRTGARHDLESGAVLQKNVAYHFYIRKYASGIPSVETQINILRLLWDRAGTGGQLPTPFPKPIPLVVTVHSADIMAKLIELKKYIENPHPPHLPTHPPTVTFVGATEAHLLAKEIAEAHIGVIVTPPRPFPTFWEQRRVYVLPFMRI